VGPIACTDPAGLVKMRNRARLDSSYSALGCRIVMRRKIKKILLSGADDLPETSFISELLESALSVSTVVRFSVSDYGDRWAPGTRAFRVPEWGSGARSAIPAIMEAARRESSRVIDSSPNGGLTGQSTSIRKLLRW
jgi:hypothetical protein